MAQRRRHWLTHGRLIGSHPPPPSLFLPGRYYHINPTLLAYQAQAQQQQQAQQPFHFLPPPHDSKTKQQQSPASPLANLQDFSLFLNDIKDAGACVACNG